MSKECGANKKLHYEDLGDLPNIDENTPPEQVLDHTLKLYDRIEKNILSIRKETSSLIKDLDNMDEAELRKNYRATLETMIGMTEILETAYEHVRVVSIIFRLALEHKS